MKKRFFLVLLMSCFALFTSASNYLTFTAEVDKSSFRIKNMGSNNLNVEYSLDDGETWTLLETDIEGDSKYVSLKRGDKVLLRGNNPDGFSKNDSKYSCFNMKGKIAASGSVMSLIDGIGESKTIPCAFCFSHLFLNCESLTQAPELTATKLAEFCYQDMFDYCTSLTQAPELPATELDEWCYTRMFANCTSLTQGPTELPATKLAKKCYEYMFHLCTSLNQAPALPATELADNCYSGMFDQCTSLTQAPKLPAMELAYECYHFMFSGCTSLTQAPALPATKLANSCYNGMFEDCTSLTQAPELPAMELIDFCYFCMFKGCISLSKAPTLPATKLTFGCYEEMFEGCTSLTQAPELPATELVAYCYEEMFEGCTSLTQAPELPATELVEGCYTSMFQGCENLQTIKVGFEFWRNGRTNSWVKDVAPKGTFYCPKSMYIKFGVDYIPEGWTVKYIDMSTAVAEYVSDASFKAWGADGKITYIGATMPVRIYDLGGKLIKEVKGETQSVSVPQHGTYVVKSGTVNVKVEL